MSKRVFIILLIIILFIPPLFSVSTGDVNLAIGSLVDSVSASVLSSFMEKSLILPSTSITFYQNTKLPARISFFLADPSDFQEAIKNNSRSQNLFTFFFGPEKDPLRDSIYEILQKKNYKESEFLINGSISFEYPDDITLEQFIELFKNESQILQKLGIAVNVTVFGSKLSEPVSIYGAFSASLESSRHINVTSVDEYMINGVSYTNGGFYIAI